MATLKINGEAKTFDAPDDMPLLWVLPLTLYLLTFILCFEGRGWYSRLVFLIPLLAVMALRPIPMASTRSARSGRAG